MTRFRFISMHAYSGWSVEKVPWTDAHEYKYNKIGREKKRANEH